ASTPPVYACGRERSRAVRRVARREGASLSVAAVNLDGLRSRRGYAGHHCALARPIPVAPARSVGGHRQPAGRRRQSCATGGRTCPGPRLHPPFFLPPPPHHTFTPLEKLPTRYYPPFPRLSPPP